MAHPATPPMDSEQLARLLPEVRQIAIDAGASILEVRRTGYEVYEKTDRSPVTTADLAAHQCIFERLEALDERWPVLSEENPSPTPWEDPSKLGHLLAGRSLGRHARTAQAEQRIHCQYRSDPPSTARAGHHRSSRPGSPLLRAPRRWRLESTREKNRPPPYTAALIPPMEPQSWQSVSATRDPKCSDSSGGSDRIRRNGSEVRLKVAKLLKEAWICIRVAVRPTNGTRRLPNVSWKKRADSLSTGNCNRFATTSGRI